MKTSLFFCAFMLSASFTTVAYAQTGLPPAVNAYVEGKEQTPLSRVGSGTYRKLGFTIYHATLWATDGTYDTQQPYALQIRYARSLSKDTVVDTVVDDIRSQQVADSETFARWEALLRDVLPGVEDGDEIIGVSVPGKEARLYFNGKEITRIQDMALSNAFFAIWFGKNADSSLKNQLLGKSQ